jgi:hypothetical protein
LPKEKRTRNLTRYELETVINFNQEETDAYVFTYEVTWQKHIEQRLKIQPYLVNDSGGKSYRIPKKLIGKPRCPKKLTDEQRKAIGQRLSKNRVSKQT